MSNSADSVTISYAISGKTLNGTAFSFTKTQTITKSKAGEEGEEGAEGGGVQFAYLDNNSASAPSAPTAIGTGGWTASPTGVTASNKYEWVSQRTSVDGSFGSFSTPTQFANFAEDGGTGPSGDDGLRTVTGRVNFANSVATAAVSYTHLTLPTISSV